MDCSHARNILLEYLEGQLEFDGRVQLEAHLLGCQECRDELDAMKVILQSVASLPAPSPSPGFARRLRARIRQERRRGFSRFWANRGAFVWVATLAAFLLAAGAGLWVVHSASPSPAQREWVEPTEGRDRSLLLLALGEEVSAEEMLQAWASIAPPGWRLDAFGELSELSEQELMALLARWGEG